MIPRRRDASLNRSSGRSRASPRNRFRLSGIEIWRGPMSSDFGMNFRRGGGDRENDMRLGFSAGTMVRIARKCNGKPGTR